VFFLEMSLLIARIELVPEHSEPEEGAHPPDCEQHRKEVNVAMSDVISPISTDQALEMLTAALGYLAAADATEMTAEEQARCLKVLERATAIGAAARTSTLSAFTSGKGYSADAQYSAKTWLVYKTGVTKGAAASHTAWMRRALEHPAMFAAMAAGDVSEPVARLLCQWTDKIPEARRADADTILVAAAVAGTDLPHLAELYGEIYERSQPEAPSQDKDEAFDDRSVRLETTFGGAGVVSGDLTPECAAVVAKVLDALSAPGGEEDDRSQAQRYHDALQEAMQRLVTANLVPERAGQPVKVWAHITLADLMRLDGSSALLDEWTTQVRARWAGHRAAASEGGGDGGLWLDGDAAEAIACDAAMAPIVTGDVNPDALDDLIRLCVELDRLRRDGEPRPDTTPAWAAIERAVIGKAVDLLSGPGGLASFLRRRQLGARLAGPSLPLDIGYSETIPPGIRNAVILRDRHCRFPGCHQPASVCQVHHVKHKKNGGETSTTDCVLLCRFHHLIVIHTWDWSLVLNRDGTTTAWNKDRTKVLHSHGPPVRPG
jgi:hypothetical protein